MSEPHSPADAEWPEALNYMLRTAQQSHVQLSLIADQKASILVGASFVVFTLALRDGASASPSITSIILATAAFLSAVFSVWAIIPSVGSGKGQRRNLLFFGSFAEMDEQDYVDQVLKDTKTPEQVYRMMLHDLHQNGRVLHDRKYRYLAYAFRIFLVGLVLSFCAYIAEMTVLSA